MTRRVGLAPVVGARPAVLLLGSFPGEESLRTGQYYAYPRNQFWPIIAAVLASEDPIDYPDRLRMVMQGGIALWDVVAACERRGSSDGAIRDPEANAIGALLDEQSTLRTVCFNGKKAEELFWRLGAALSRQGQEEEPREAPGRRFIGLPSTSPANARQGYREKLRIWSEALGPVLSLRC